MKSLLIEKEFCIERESFPDFFFFFRGHQKKIWSFYSFFLGFVIKKRSLELKER